MSYLMIFLPRYNGTNKGLLYLGLEFLLLVVSLVVMLLTLNAPNFISSIASPPDASPALSLLKTYNLQYRLLIGGMIFNVVLLICGGLFSLWKIYSQQLASMLAPVIYTILLVGFGIFLNMVMIVQEDVFVLVEQSAQDIQQVESNQLSTMTVGFSRRTYDISMPGPYSSSVPKPLTRWGVIDMLSDKPTGWVDVFVPHELNFKLQDDEFYRENQSISYNQENTHRFQVYFTENFKLVTKIERLP